MRLGQRRCDGDRFLRILERLRPYGLTLAGQIPDPLVSIVVRTLDRPAAPDPLWSAEAPDSATSSAPYRVYNIGNNQPVNLLDFVSTLERVIGTDPRHEVVVHNLKYWGAQSNDGFRMWKSKHEAFEGDGHKFSYDGTNGFLITVHFSGNAKPTSAD